MVVLAMLLPTLLLAVSPAAAPLHARFDAEESKLLTPLLQEVLRFPTVAGNAQAHAAQKKWIFAVAARFGLAVRDHGEVVEVELAGPEDAPVLGLVVHGDVVPVEEAKWGFPPFAGIVAEGEVRG